MPGPLLIALPHGLGVSGVTTWALRLATARAERGQPSALLVHGEAPGHQRLADRLPDAVELVDLADLPPLDTAQGDLSPYISRYRDEVRKLTDRHQMQVVVSPNLLGDCYGIAAGLCLAEPEHVRVVGWHHSDLDYNNHVLRHYEPILARLVVVSDHLGSRLRRHVPHRAGDIVNIPYGVPVADEWRPRQPLNGRAIRLIATGRLEHEQKRIMVLARLAEQLARRGIDHELTVIGDGPGAADFEAAIYGLTTVRRLPPQHPDEIEKHLDRNDVLVLASRYEGLSLSMIEAMARGCVPIVTRVESGAAQAIQSGVNGELADASPDDDEQAARLADAVERFRSADTAALSEAAWRTARESFSIERHADAVERLLQQVVADTPRSWPAGRPCAFNGRQPSGATGSVPADGAACLKTVLIGLAGRRVVIHGTGEHTMQMADVLAKAPARIVAFTDDDPQRYGKKIWNWPIIAPSVAASMGATDVVISSWINQRAIWDRRGVYEEQGLTVHRLYDGKAAA